MARLQKLKLPKGVEIDEVSNDNFFTHPSARSVPTTLAVKDYLRDEINKHDQEFMPDGLYRNAIINGNFDIWQRGTSFTDPGGSSGGYSSDRWFVRKLNVERQNFAPGQSDVPGEPRYYMRITSYEGWTGYIHQRIEDVRSFAGKTVTLSFFAKADRDYATIKTHGVRLTQNFGSGGSSEVEIPVALVNLTTHWQKLAFTIDIPSISGKTVGPGSYLQVRLLNTESILPQVTIDIAQVQLNLGDKPLPFSPRPIAEELALCQRYYHRITAASNYSPFAIGFAYDASGLRCSIQLPSSMRVTPTLTYKGNFRVVKPGGVPLAVTEINTVSSTPDMVHLSANVASGLDPGMSAYLTANSDITAYLAFDAEL